MTNSNSDIEKLKSLQREAKKRRAERRKPHSTTTHAEEKQSEITEDLDVTSKSAAQGSSAAESPVPESKKTLQDLFGQIENLVKEMEDAASERPLLALLAAFSLGIIIGQLFSRR